MNYESLWNKLKDDLWKEINSGNTGEILSAADILDLMSAIEENHINYKLF